MKEVFGAVISVKDNVSGTLKAITKESKSFNSEVKKVRDNIETLNKKKISEKELKIKSSKAYKAIEGVMKKLKPIKDKAVVLKAKTEIATKKIKDLKDKLSGLKENKTINFAVKGMSGIAKTVTAIGVAGTVAGLAIFSAGAINAVKSAAEFEAQMKNVSTLLDGDVNGKIANLGKGVKKVSMDTGISTESLTLGLYEVISAFGESGDSVKQLSIAAKAAKAGNAETADSVKMLSAVTKGYGDTSAKAVEKASDLAFATVKLGQTSFSELAASMGSVVPIASSMKVSQEELFGAMATLTGVTGGTAEVSTQLKATMQGFMNPTKEMSSALKKMGYSSGAAALESESLGEILNKLKTSVNGDTVAFANMFSSVEAKNAVLALAGTQAENFASKTEAMKNAAGSAEEAFKRQTSSVKEMANNIKNKGLVLLMDLGEKALPYVSKALDIINTSMPQMSSAVSKVVDKVSPLFTRLADIFNSSIGNIDLSVISSLFEERFDKIVEIVNVASPIISSLFIGIKDVISEVSPAVENIVNGFGDKLSGLFGVLSEHSAFFGEVLSNIGPVLREVFDTTWAIVSPIIDLIISSVDLLLSAFEKAFPAIKTAVKTTWDIVKPIFEALGKGISLLSDGVKAVANFISGDNKSGKVDANATGTTYFSGGYTTVGEHGPELVQLPRGSKIFSNSNTKGILNTEGCINININNMTVREEADIDKIAKKIVEEIKKVDR